MQNYVHRVRTSIARLPDKKQYIELVTATLTVPVLATAIVLNLNNLKPKSVTSAPTPSPVQEKIIYVSPNETNSDTKTVVPTSKECKTGIAPLTITSPTEGETLSDNPVNITIDYEQGNYCSAVWSYRINGGKWSDYDDKSIALYNLPSGKIQFDLRVKSLVGTDETTYSRTFTYTGSTESITPVLSQPAVSSSSASQ